VLNTLQYLIVDEILLARVLEQQKGTFHTHFRDDESTEDITEEYNDGDDEATEYDPRKGPPIIL
jgi:hypothetical protein